MNEKHEMTSAIIKAIALYLIILAAVFYLTGCATVETPNGLKIRYAKMPFLDTDVATIYKHEWLDENNVLHEESLTINANMASQNQVEALKAGLAAAAAMYGTGGGVK